MKKVFALVLALVLMVAMGATGLAVMSGGLVTNGESVEVKFSFATTDTLAVKIEWEDFEPVGYVYQYDEENPGQWNAGKFYIAGYSQDEEDVVIQTKNVTATNLSGADCIIALDGWDDGNALDWCPAIRWDSGNGDWAFTPGDNNGDPIARDESTTSELFLPILKVFDQRGEDLIDEAVPVNGQVDIFWHVLVEITPV